MRLFLGKLNIVVKLIFPGLMLSGWLARPEGHNIIFERPERVGDKLQFYRTVASKDTVIRSFPGASESKSNDVEGELAAVLEVLAVDHDARGTKYAYTIEKLVQTRNGRNAEMLTPGKRVFVTVEDGKRLYYLQDGGLTEEASRLLRVCLGQEQVNRVDYDEALGTPVPQTPGGTWRITSPKLQDLILLPRGYVWENRPRGVGKLLGLTNFLGTPCLNISIQIEGTCVPNRELDIELRKSGAGIKMMELKSTQGGLFPTDPRKWPFEFFRNSTVTATNEVKNPISSVSAAIIRLTEESERTRWLPLPKETGRTSP